VSTINFNDVSLANDTSSGSSTNILSSIFLKMVKHEIHSPFTTQTETSVITVLVNCKCWCCASTIHQAAENMPISFDQHISSQTVHCAFDK
jgi:hypothetical protein